MKYSHINNDITGGFQIVFQNNTFNFVFKCLMYFLFDVFFLHECFL